MRSFTSEIFRCVRIDRGCPLPTFRSTEPVLSIFRKRSLTELKAHFFCRNSEQIRLAPHLFSCLRTLIKHFSSNVNGIVRNLYFVDKTLRHYEVGYIG